MKLTCSLATLMAGSEGNIFGVAAIYQSKRDKPPGGMHLGVMFAPQYQDDQHKEISAKVAASGPTARLNEVKEVKGREAYNHFRKFEAGFY